VKNSSSSTSADTQQSTKRQGLARIESIFDPLGLVSPTVIAHKTFPQKLWHDNSLWDEQRHPHCGGMVKNGLRRFFKPQQTPPSHRLLQTIRLQLQATTSQHSTSRKTKDNLLRQWHQFPGCS
jgi:hypothetical protein